MKTIPPLSAKSLLLSTLLSVGLTTGALASSSSSYFPQDEDSKIASSSGSVAPAGTFIDQTHVHIHDAPDALLMKITQGQQAVKGAVRAALEKKLVEEYQPLETMRLTLRAAGVDDNAVANEAFEGYFLATFQSGIVSEYLKNHKIIPTAHDYCTSSGKQRKVKWGRQDDETVVEILGSRRLCEWAALLGSTHAEFQSSELCAKAASPATGFYLHGMAHANDIYLRGHPYLMGLHAHVSQKKADYKLMTFGK